MKSSHLLSVVGVLLAVLLGCGGGGKMGGGGNNPPPPPNTFAENWHFDTVSNLSAIPPTVNAALTLSSNTVAGGAHIAFQGSSGNCYDFFDNVPLSGTIDAGGTVSVKSSAMAGQVFSFTGFLTADRSSLSSGNYTFSGGCANGEGGQLTGAKYKPLTGLYAGTMQWSGNTVSVSTQLTQASTSGSDGFFVLTGTVVVDNAACPASFTLNGASVVGNVVHLYSNTDSGLEGLTGIVDSEAQQIELDDYLYLGDCIAGAHGIVTRQ